MRLLTMEQTADYLIAAELKQSVDYGYAIVHHGINEAGNLFMMVNDWEGNTVVTESL